MSRLPDGTFRIAGVSPGAATLEFSADGHASERIQVDVQSEQTKPIRVPLKREGILTGYVTRNGKPSASGYVTMPNIENGPYSFTSANGHYEIKGLKAGAHLIRYTMWLYEDKRGGAQMADCRWVEVASGRQTRLDIEYHGSGVIEGAFQGPEDDKWHVSVYDGTLPGGDQLRASTWKFKSNGRYENHRSGPRRLHRCRHMHQRRRHRTRAIQSRVHRRRKEGPRGLCLLTRSLTNRPSIRILVARGKTEANIRKAVPIESHRWRRRTSFRS